MGSEFIGFVGAVGFLTIWVAAAWIGLRASCRGERPAPDWLQTWGEETDGA